MFHDMNGGFMWFGMIFWLILFGVIIWAILTIVNKNKGSSRDISDTPLDILKKRYAIGEITKEQFEDMKKNIL